MNTSEKNSHTSHIIDIIQQRNIRWLCHFTPRENLENIRQNGLKPRNLLSNAHITDTVRYDRHSDAICLSISKPNSWMFNMKQKQGLDLCLLLIKPEVMHQKRCLFFPHNAATASYKYVSDEKLQTSQALEELFANEVNFQRSGKEPTKIWRSYHLAKCETTSDQAEVQCLDTIEPEYIMHFIEKDIPLTLNEIENYVNQYKPSGELREFLNPNDRSIFELMAERERLKHQLEKQKFEWKKLKSEQENKKLKNTREIEKITNNNPISPKTKTSSQDKTPVRLDVNKNKSNNYSTDYSSSSSSGDGCLGIIILVILIYIFIF